MKTWLQISVIAHIGKQMLYIKEESQGYSLPLVPRKFSYFCTEMDLKASLHSVSFL